ncbi:hypothetical protein [Priestia aryabhattai]|uniref:hypothetical protein n=1 Tax=Priestia aryabhattai TaxID=412384 RepID=UPI0015F5BA41|nr:hypothetical protein [Priestia aryabhattai]
MDYHTKEYRDKLSSEIELLDQKLLLLKVMKNCLNNGEDVTELGKKIKALGV